MSTLTSTKPLGEPIEGEDRGATVTCPSGHLYGLYFYGVRNDFCRTCEKQRARAGDQAAAKRLEKLDRARWRAKREQRFAEDGARVRAEATRSGARWEPWETRSAKGF